MKLNKLSLILLSVLLSILLINCNSSQKVDSNKGNKTALEEITAHMEKGGGFCDVFLHIVADKKTDKSHIYTVKGLYKGKTVGLQAEVKNGIGAGLSSEGITSAAFKDDGIVLSSIGQESDEFVKALSSLYKLPATKPFSKKSIKPAAVSLNESAVDFNSNKRYAFKLFFEADASGNVPELFFNLDLAKQIIELNEKDEEYREGVIKALTN